MKFSMDWLGQFLPLPVGPDELSRHLLMLGFEVASMQSLGPGFTGVVIGEILDIRKHPNADRLSLCSVSDGQTTLPVVCGARNIGVGARVPLARIGAILPGGREIRRSNIRGVESQGMICSASELGLPENDGGGILLLPRDAPVGQDAARTLGRTDVVLELEITPNRPDCLSHYGLARELSIYFMIPLKTRHPDPPRACEGAKSREVIVEAKDACRRYLGRDLSGLRVGASPGWMARRLEAVGLRPVNAVVDVTNYVLLEWGHPLHAFDADKLRGERIRVRYARAGERLKALNGKEYAPTPEDLVIADDAGPVAIAGIMGGEETGVTEKTGRAFLEAAQFAPGRIRGTSKRLGLRSDSSLRFERGTDPETAAMAAARAAQLVAELCGHPVLSSPTDVYPERSTPPPIVVHPDGINRLLGTSHPPDRVLALLKSLSGALHPAGDSWTFHPPGHRLDLAGLSDLAEEVGRHLGYDSIGSQAAPVKPTRPERSPMPELCERLRLALPALGFSEAYNHDFVSASQLFRAGVAADPGCVGVLNPLSEDQAYLRPTLLIGLLQNAAYNLDRGAPGLRLFEIGRTYASSGAQALERTELAGILLGPPPLRPHWRSRPGPADFYDAKGAVQELLRRRPEVLYRVPEDGPGPLFHPKAALELRLPQGRLGRVGLLHPEALRAWDLEGRSVSAFTLDLDLWSALAAPARRPSPISPFPSASRDLSFTVPAAVPYARIESALDGLPALSRLDLLDVYTGEGVAHGRKSLTLRLTLGLQDRTLRDAEIERSMRRAMEVLARDCGAQPRS